MELLTREEVEELLPDLSPTSEEYKALDTLRSYYYLLDEGFITVEGNRCFAEGQ